MRKLSIRSLVATLSLFACAALASGQVTNISGKVTLKQADGTTVPSRGAQVDIYRTDIKQEFHAKTDVNGSYQQAGIPFVGTYTVIVSAPGATPKWQEKVRFSSVTTLDFMLQPGNGAHPTLEDIKAYELKVKGVEDHNRKITESNEIISRTFKAGNDALRASRFDEAIVNYREGLAARPDEPALLTNLSEALRLRGAERYNAAIKTKPRNQAGIDAAGKDWTEAAASSTKAVNAIKAAAATADAQEQQILAQNKIGALSTRALAMRLVATKVDQTQAQAAWNANLEYLAVETDPVKKTRSQVDALQALFDAGAIDMAVLEGRRVLAQHPNNIDVHRIMGLSLFATGDNTKFQEAANSLQRYVDMAPDTDPLKAPARDALQYLISTENITPQKMPTPTRPAPHRRP